MKAVEISKLRIVLAVLVSAMMFVFGLGVFAFGYDVHDPLALASAIWIGPMLALPALGLIALSRRALVLGLVGVYIVNYIGSLIHMARECSDGHCLETHVAVLNFVEIPVGALLTPQSVSSLVVVLLVTLNARRIGMRAQC
jgi:hypothetical protein